MTDMTADSCEQLGILGPIPQPEQIPDAQVRAIKVQAEGFAALPLVDMAAALAAGPDQLPTRDTCDLCARHARPCIVHMTSADWDAALARRAVRS